LVPRVAPDQIEVRVEAQLVDAEQGRAGEQALDHFKRRVGLADARQHARAPVGRTRIMAILTRGLEPLEPANLAQGAVAAAEGRQGHASPDMGDRIVRVRPILGQQSRHGFEPSARGGAVASKSVRLRGDQCTSHDGLRVRLGCRAHGAKQREDRVRAALPQQQDQTLVGERPTPPPRIDFQRQSPEDTAKRVQLPPP
jgi:hypothetical protein